MKKCTEIGDEMKVLVTGVGGQLGYDVVKELERRKIECIGADLKEFDITDYDAAHAFITAHKPDAIIHCSAYTAVDRAEEEPELCHIVNVLGTENIAKICKEINAKMIYISTDYVFPGTGAEYYEVDSPTGHQNIYGQTKLKGEIAVKSILDKYFIVRISWVFGINGNNFIKTMLKLGKERSEINVVADQIGSPTYTADLGPLLCDMVSTEKYGTYHATNEEICSWAEFAEEIFKIAKIDCKVNHIKTEEYPTKAVRPKNSRMSKKSLDAAGFNRLPYWQDAVERYLEEMEDKVDVKQLEQITKIMFYIKNFDIHFRLLLRRYERFCEINRLGNKDIDVLTYLDLIIVQLRAILVLVYKNGHEKFNKLKLF